MNLFFLGVYLLLSFLPAYDSCGFNAAHQCRDLSTLSNRDLGFFADLQPHGIEAIFRELNVVRTVGSSGHKKVQRFIKNYLRRLEWHVTEDNFTAQTPVGTKAFANIVGSSRESAPHHLVLACHYDSKDFGSELSGQPFIGATDSAVPCAILLHLASALSSALTARHDLSLDLVFFDGEEAFGKWTDANSIYGAKNLAAVWSKQPHGPLVRKAGGSCSRLDSIDALILLDLIGERGLQLHNLYSDNACSSVIFEQFKLIETRLRNRNKISVSVPPIFGSVTYTAGAGIEDDHLPFLRKGVNIVHLIALPFPTAWHTVHDNANNLHWDTIHNMNTITRVFVAYYFGLRGEDVARISK